MSPDTGVLLLIKLLLLIGVANGAPLFGHTLLRQRWAWPLDGGARFLDRRPLLGPAKTIRGVLLALLVTPLAALLLGLPVVAGILAGCFAMIGDMLSSFTKRRLGLATHSQALGLDQIPESLLPLLAVRPLFALTPGEILGLVAAFVVLELAVSKVLYRLRLRDQPY